MAERRMFAKKIIDSDEFLDLPLSAQALYFHLSMRADDDGFVNNAKRIKGMIGAADDDFRLLLLRRFLLPFESGVVVIRHWKIHNYIRTDRYAPTNYQEELKQLSQTQNGYEYHENATSEDSPKLEKTNENCLPSGIPSDNQVSYQRYPQDSIVKYSTGEYRDNNNISAPDGAPTKKTVSSPTPELPPFGDELREAVLDWLAYKSERRDGYKPQGMKALLTEVRHNAEQHGEAAVVSLIRQSMAANWRGIAWDKLKQTSRGSAQAQTTNNPFVAARMVVQGLSKAEELGADQMRAYIEHRELF